MLSNAGLFRRMAFEQERMARATMPRAAAREAEEPTTSVWRCPEEHARLTATLAEMAAGAASEGEAAFLLTVAGIGAK